MRLRALGWCVAAVVLAGCAAPKKDDTIEATFACDGGARLSVTFDNKAGVAIVRTQAGGMHVLNRTVSGSGYAYEGDGRRLRGKGQDATWTDANAPSLACSERRN